MTGCHVCGASGLGASAPDKIGAGTGLDSTYKTLQMRRWNGKTMWERLDWKPSLISVTGSMWIQHRVVLTSSKAKMLPTPHLWCVFLIRESPRPLMWIKQYLFDHDLLGFSGIGHANKSSLRITRPEAEGALSQTVFLLWVQPQNNKKLISRWWAVWVFLFLNTDFHMQEMWAVPTSFIFAIELMYKQPRFQICYFMVITWMGSRSTELLKAGLCDPKTLKGTFWTDANWN